MPSVKSIIFRYLSQAEFFNMYKPRGTEPGGGGQKYIDFKKSAVSLPQWHEFLSGVPEVTTAQGAHGRPRWTVPVRSIGVHRSSDSPQVIEIYQRRAASVCIPNQHLHSRGANRVLAWTQARGFPVPRDANDRHQLPNGLAVYLVRTHEGEVWAGWFLNPSRQAAMLFSADVTRLLQELVRSSEAGRAGYVMFRPDVLLFDGTSQTEPFSTTSQPSSYERGEDNTTKTLLAEDVDLGGTMNSAVRKAIVMIRQRNQKAVKALKKLYGHRCQVTGVQFTFKKKDGQWYSEAHHLIPLGKGGADDPRNIIIVSPLIHRMLHYADVSTVSMSNLHENDDGSASLAIRINNTDYTVVWHSLHASKVLGR